MSILRGEWWIDDNGDATYADGDVGDQNHEMVAFESLSGIGSEELGMGPSDFDVNSIVERYLDGQQTDVTSDDIEKMSPAAFKKFAKSLSINTKRKGDFSKAEIVALQELEDRGANPSFFEWFFDAGNAADARDYALEHKGWIRVQGDHFQVWDFNDDALDRIKNFDGWEETENPEELENSEDEIYIEQYKDNKTWTISLKDIFKATSAEGLKRYKDGIGKWRNPAQPTGEFPYGFFTPKGKFKRAGMNHAWLARAMGFENVDAAIKSGYIRVSYPEGGSRLDVIELFDLDKSLPVLQKAIRSYYEALGDVQVLLEEREKNEVYATSLSVVALGSADEIRHGIEKNPGPQSEVDNLKEGARRAKKAGDKKAAVLLNQEAQRIANNPPKYEYVIWGVPPDQDDEVLLLSSVQGEKIIDMVVAKRLAALLETKYKATKTRIQKIDLENFDWMKEVRRAL